MKIAEKTARWTGRVLMAGLLLAAGLAWADSSPVEETLVAPAEKLVPLEAPSKPAEGEAANAEASKAEPASSEKPQESPASDTKGAPPPAYRIRPGDVLSFHSYDDDTLSLPEVIVRYDGCVSLPLIHDLNLGGLTRDEAISTIREAYTSVFKEPQFALTIVNAAGQSFYVMGDVNRPSEFPYRKTLNVLQAINTAGGLRDRSNATGESYNTVQGTLSVAYIIRHLNGPREVIKCDLKGLTNTGPHPSELQVWPEDVVYVPEGVNLVYISGAVQQPGVLNLVEGETLLQVLARSSGFIEESASMGKVVVMRRTSEKDMKVMLVNVKKAYKTGHDMPMEPGDIIYVPRKPLIRLQEFVSRFTGSILPIMELYREAYDTYYTQKRYDALFNDSSTSSATTLSTLQSLRDFGDLFLSIPTTTSTTQ